MIKHVLAVEYLKFFIRLKDNLIQRFDDLRNFNTDENVVTCHLGFFI